MKVRLRNQFAFTIPRKFREYSKIAYGDVVEVLIKENGVKDSYITLTQNGFQIAVKRAFIKKFQFKEGQSVNVEINKLKAINPSKTFLENNKIDLLSLIPFKSRKEFPINIFSKYDKLAVFEYVKRGHRADPIIINRFLPFDFVKFLGLVQAEGEKKINRKGGNALTFTNVNINLLQFVVKILREILVDSNLIIVRALIPKGTSKKRD